MRANARIAGVDDLSGPEAWYRSLPVITKWWFTGAFVLTCAANFKLISVLKLLFLWEPIKSNFEIWRFLTPFLYVGPFDISTLFGLYMMVNFSRIYESGGPFNTGGGGGTADYAFMMLFGCAAMLLSYILLAGIIPPVFTRNLSYFVLYVWSKQNPEAPANIWGFPLKAMWLPFAYLAVTVLMGNSFWDVAHGIAIGHIYYFLVEVVPSVYRKDVLHTPQLLIDYFGVGEYVPPQPVRNLAAGQGSNVWQAPGRAQPPRDPGGAGPTRGHNWGEGGQRLGAS